MSRLFYNAKSEIEGDGVFAKKALSIGQEFYVPKTIVRRGYNHACIPNAKLLGNGYIRILRDIAKDEEITVDYHITHGLRGCRCPSCRARNP
jgi:hypothetical protein